MLAFGASDSGSNPLGATQIVCSRGVVRPIIPAFRGGVGTYSLRLKIAGHSGSNPDGSILFYGRKIDQS